MTPEIKDLLAVLDMTTIGQQRDWLSQNAGILFKLSLGIEENFADLAFRLRDEVISNDLKNETSWWCEAEYEVFLHIIGEENEKDEIGLDTWCSMYAKPIHWIIIAIRAEILSKGETQ